MSDTSLVVFHSCIDWLPQTQTWMHNQIRLLPENIDNHILCERLVNEDQFALANIYSLCHHSMWRCMSIKALRRLGVRRKVEYFVRKTRLHHAEVLHSHFGNKGWEDSILACSEGLKHIVTFYGADVGLLPQRLPEWYQRYRDLFQHVDLVLCEGPFMAQSVIGLGCPENKVRVHHLGVDLEKFVFRPLPWQPQEPLKVLLAASFREKKGIPYALAALGELQRDVDLQITIIGGATGEQASKVEEQNILQVIEKYDLQSQVRTLGFQPYDVLIEQMYRNHIFLSPSVVASSNDTEGGAPVSIIEAVAAGMVVVSTTHCDIPEVILHGQTGLLAQERNVDELVANMRWLLKNPGSWQHMVKAGRKRIECEFNAQVQAERLAALYEAL